MSQTINQIKNTVIHWAEEDSKFVSGARGSAAAGSKARKHLAEIMKLCKQRRVEIQEAKNAEKEAKAS